MDTIIARIAQVSGISRDIGQVLFATVLIEPLMRGIINIWSIGLGTSLSLLLWFISIYLLGIKPYD